MKEQDHPLIESATISMVLIVAFVILLFTACSKKNSTILTPPCVAEHSSDIFGCKPTQFQLSAFDSLTGNIIGYTTTYYSYNDNLYMGYDIPSSKLITYTTIVYDACKNFMSYVEYKNTDTWQRTYLYKRNEFAYAAGKLIKINYYLPTSPGGNLVLQKTGRANYGTNYIATRFTNLMGEQIETDTSFYNDAGDLLKRVVISNGVVTTTRFIPDPLTLNPFDSLLNFEGFEKPSKHLSQEEYTYTGDTLKSTTYYSQITRLPNGYLNKGTRYYRHVSGTGMQGTLKYEEVYVYMDCD